MPNQVVTGILSGIDVPRQGNVRVQAPAAGDWLGDNFEISDYESNLPTITAIETKYSGRFDDERYYTGDTSN